MTTDDSTLASYLQDLEKLSKLSASAKDDRTLAIVCAAYCEKYTAALIAENLPGLNAKLRKTLFEGFGPLSTAASRFHLAKAMGLINQDSYDNLRRLASIRNLFAHNLEITSIDDPAIVDEMNKMSFVPCADAIGQIASVIQELPRRDRFGHMSFLLAVSLANALTAQSNRRKGRQKD